MISRGYRLTFFFIAAIAICLFPSFGAYALSAKSNRVSTLYVLPDDQLSLEGIADELNQAKKSIDVVVYTINDNHIIQALIDAHNRGVQVRFLLQKYVYDDTYFNYPVYNELKKDGVEVQWAPTTNPYVYTHQKSWVIDDEVAYISTGNFTDQTAAKQRNFYVKTTDADYIKEMKKVFDADWAGTSPTLKNPLELVWSPMNSKDAIIDLVK